ncbi:hypothetical protein [Legionella micdadei]|nr:hypothetical protein [Legionella micdadei]
MEKLSKPTLLLREETPAITTKPKLLESHTDVGREEPYCDRSTASKNG